MSESVQEWSKKLVGKKFLEEGKQGEDVIFFQVFFRLYL